MSHENVELVRRFIEAFNGGDLEGAIALVDPVPESEFMPGDFGPEPATAYRGPEGMRRASERFWGEFDDPQIELHELIDAGEQVIVSATFRGRGKRSGAETSWALSGVYSRCGRAAWFAGRGSRRTGTRP